MSRDLCQEHGHIADRDLRAETRGRAPFDATPDYDRRLVSLNGELDSTTVPVMLAAAAELMQQPGDLTLDFAGIRFISAAGLNATVRIREEQHARGSDVWLTGGSSAIRRVFAAGGLGGLAWTQVLSGAGKLSAVTADAHDHLRAEADAARRTIESLQQALQTSRRIGAAIGVIMATLKLTEAEAFEVLRHASQNHDRKLRDIADDVVATGVMPGRGDAWPPARRRPPISVNGAAQAADTATSGR